MIPLTSDTETRPTDAMRDAIAAARVGDEQRGEDPSVNELLERVADLLGMEAALFLPTGTMCNLIAVKVHTQPGDVLLAERDAHVLRAESGGAGLVSGVITEPIAGGGSAGLFSDDDGDPGAGAPVPGTFTIEELRRAIDRLATLPAPYAPPATLLCVEQTHNFGGGAIWPLARLAGVSAHARDRGLAVHMDGARLLNAVVASGVPAHEWCAHVDSAWIDFTKGLGAPLGAVLAGSRAFIAQALRYKHAFGGAMRQAGIAAAGCLYALEHHVDRLAEDHANATRLATGLAALSGLRLVYGMPQTNIVFFEPEPGTCSAAELARDGMACGGRAAAGGAGRPEPWIAELLRETAGPVVAASDYVRAVPESIRAFVPPLRSYVTLGTDGFGRSDTRAALRAFFGVDAASIAAAARAELARAGGGRSTRA